MKVETIHDDMTGCIVRVTPWPEQPGSADIDVRLVRRDLLAEGDFTRTSRAGEVTIAYSRYGATIAHAREWAHAILKACAIAEALQAEFKAATPDA